MKKRICRGCQDIFLIKPGNKRRLCFNCLILPQGGSGGGDEGEPHPSWTSTPCNNPHQQEQQGQDQGDRSQADSSLVTLHPIISGGPVYCGATTPLAASLKTMSLASQCQAGYPRQPHHSQQQHHVAPTDSCYSSSAASSPLPQRIVMSPDAGYYSPETTLNRSEQPTFESFQEHLPDGDDSFQRSGGGSQQDDDSLPEVLPALHRYDGPRFHPREVADNGEDTEEHLQVDDSAYVEAKTYFVPSSIAKRRPLSGSLLSLTTSSDRSDSSEVDWAAKLNNGWLLPLDLDAVPHKIPFGAQRVPGTVPYRDLPPVKNAADVETTTPLSKSTPSIILREQKRSTMCPAPLEGLPGRPRRRRDELTDLLDLYSSLRLDEDEDLLLRAERRDLPEKFQRSYRLRPKRRFSNPSFRRPSDLPDPDDISPMQPSSCKTPPARRAAIPDRILDDLATRRFSSQSKSLKDYEPRSPDSIPLPRDHRLPTQCYLRLSPLFTPALNCPCASLMNIFNEADAERDDVLYRNVLHKQWKRPERQPPMGIPLTAETQPPQLTSRGHYLTASRRDMRAKYQTRATSTADPVQDDMAVRRLRKDDLEASKFTQITRV